MVETLALNNCVNINELVCTVVKSSSPSGGGVPPGDVEDDSAAADVLEDGDGLRVRHPLQRQPVHGQNLVTCGGEYHDI